MTYRRRNVCSRGGGVLSVVVGLILIRASSNGKRPVVVRTVAASRSRSPISHGGASTRITFVVLIRFKRKFTERVPTTSAATASSIPITCSATRVSSENGASGCDLRLTLSSTKTSLHIRQVSHTSRDIFVTLDPA